MVVGKGRKNIEPLGILNGENVNKRAILSISDKILKTLGEGTFGRVVKVKDMDK